MRYYSCRIDENTALHYDGKNVSIVHEDVYWGRKESFSIPTNKVGMIISALQDIQKQFRYDRW